MEAKEQKKKLKEWLRSRESDLAVLEKGTSVVCYKPYKSFGFLKCLYMKLCSEGRRGRKKGGRREGPDKLVHIKIIMIPNSLTYYHSQECLHFKR